MSIDDLVSKSVLIGATYLNDRDEVVERKQIYGVVEWADEQKGVGVQVHGSDDVLVIPPYINAFQPAEPGEYTLHSTLEIIRDPDYLVLWTFRTDGAE